MLRMHSTGLEDLAPGSIQRGFVMLRALWFSIYLGVFVVAISGCQRQREPTSKPRVVRISHDRAFIVPYPYNDPTRPHWLTGKDQIPRYPDMDIEALPRTQLMFFLKVSDILGRVDLVDVSQLSKDLVYVKVAGLDALRLANNKKLQWEKLRLSGKPMRRGEGLECFSANPENDQKCFVLHGKEYLLVELDRPGKFPNPMYSVTFNSDIHGVLYVFWNTSERNLQYWPEIQDAIMQRLEQWRYTIPKTSAQEQK